MVLSHDCILAQVQSFHRVHFYTPNWIMDKTMATNECKSVCGGDAITTLTTIQKTTKKLPQKNKLKLQNNKRSGIKYNTEKDKQATLQTNYHNTKHWWDPCDEQAEGI